jgi:methylamine utilization protein MauE/heavy metal-binding protein
MHPDIIRDAPGRCPKCGMELIAKGATIVHADDKGLGPLTWKSYLPLITIIGIILLVALTIALQNFGTTPSFLPRFIAYFMSGFFLVFSMFKLIDLKGFTAGYSTYDLLAKRVFAYGYVYPFIELFFGLAMILNYQNPALLYAEIIIMVFSGAGVVIQIAKHEKFQCVCLGTFLKVPLTKVTVFEDLGMALLAVVLLFLK